MNKNVIKAKKNDINCKIIICERSSMSSHFIFTKIIMHDDSYIDEIE